jgi:hypothetical protein
VVRSLARHAFAAAVMGSIFLGLLDVPSQVSSGEAERFSIVIRGRTVDGPHRTIRATQGTMLELAFAADETVELHLHGYDRHLPVNNGEKFAIAAVAEEIQPQSALPRDPMREWIIGLILIVSGQVGPAMQSSGMETPSYWASSVPAPASCTAVHPCAPDTTQRLLAPPRSG